MEKKILVVDDEEIIRKILEEAFTGAGYVVHTADSAEGAMQILREQSILVMYLDLRLPGMDGIELCSMIKLQNPIAIIYALTGYSDLFGLIKCRKAGFDDFFTKPVSIKELLKSAEQAFSKLDRWQVGELNLL
jgi:CheY-like chemotaxis protein